MQPRTALTARLIKYPSAPAPCQHGRKAVEGLKLSDAGEARLLSTQTLSPEQRRAETIRAFAESRKRG